MTERKRSALENQVFEVENERSLLEGDLEKERSMRLGNEDTAMQLSSELQRRIEQLYIAEENEVGYTQGCK